MQSNEFIQLMDECIMKALNETYSLTFSDKKEAYRHYVDNYCKNFNFIKQIMKQCSKVPELKQQKQNMSKIERHFKRFLRSQSDPYPDKILKSIEDQLEKFCEQTSNLKDLVKLISSQFALNYEDYRYCYPDCIEQFVAKRAKDIWNKLGEDKKQ